MQKNDILNGVLVLLETEMHVDKNLLGEENYMTSLTGDIFRFSAIELGHLLCLAEEKFQCRVEPSKICNYEFNTISGIVDVISKSGTPMKQVQV